jgi:peptidoglycan/LPS O-acetylase OafA/YrhL
MSKYRSLDGVRGLAALVVVFCHYSNAFVPSLNGSGSTFSTRLDKVVSTTPLHLPLAGNFAVYIFFVLSGFVLSQKFFLTKSATVVISSAIRRYIRLMIPALGSVLLTYLVLRAGFIQSHAVAAVTGSEWLGSFWNFQANFFEALYQGLYGVFFTEFTTYNTSLWTMHIELYGSFLVFMFLLLFGKLEKRWVVYI